MDRTRLMLAAGGTLVAGILALGVAGTAFADSGTPTTDAASTAHSGTSHRAEDFLSKLAQNLGISTDQLQTGLKTTEKQYVDQAQQSGKLSADQASTLKQKIDQSNGVSPLGRVLGRFARDHGQAHGHGQVVRHQVGEAIADTLGMTPAQLKSELQSGKTLSQVISDHGKTTDDVVNAVVAKAKARLDTAVSNGKLTAEREATILSNLKTRLTEAINSNQPQPNHSGSQHKAPSA